MDKLETVTEEQKKYAIDIIVTLTVDEIALETGEDSLSILPKFIASKTAEALYDETSKLWWNGPAYIAEMYLAESQLHTRRSDSYSACG
jgi:hypothetical protein